jgi:ABC-type nitrate/sulfonate/bicarbonate transport system ATPase subunit
LDEPFSALDALTRDRLDEELPEMIGGSSLLLVTHDIDEALLVGDRVVALGSAGLIVTETAGLRSLPAAQRRAALSAGPGKASQQALREALRV